jgi:hypothetical protein
MGQARRKKMLGIKSKRARFMYLLRLISKRYAEHEIQKLANNRNLK